MWSELDPDTTVLSVAVDAGACLVGAERRPVDLVALIDVVETEESVTVTAWLRPARTPGSFDCESVVTGPPAEVRLALPLGDRAILDGGTIPVAVVRASPTGGGQSQAYLTGVNATGIAQDEPAVWDALAVEACDAGVWDHDAAREIAARFLADHGFGSAVTVEEMAETVWLVAIGQCRDRFPAEAIEGGPPIPHVVGLVPAPTSTSTAHVVAAEEVDAAFGECVVDLRAGVGSFMPFSLYLRSGTFGIVGPSDLRQTLAADARNQRGALVLDPSFVTESYRQDGPVGRTMVFARSLDDRLELADKWGMSLLVRLHNDPTGGGDRAVLGFLPDGRQVDLSGCSTEYWTPVPRWRDEVGLGLTDIEAWRAVLESGSPEAEMFDAWLETQ